MLNDKILNDKIKQNIDFTLNVKILYKIIQNI